ncbi:hypothetical protein O0L34_g12417 [Tuta absoluta]|nr:hypothetical protein O0L34_g12417 [Tuta absoluta]
MRLSDKIKLRIRHTVPARQRRAAAAASRCVASHCTCSAEARSRCSLALCDVTLYLLGRGAQPLQPRAVWRHTVPARQRRAAAAASRCVASHCTCSAEARSRCSLALSDVTLYLLGRGAQPLQPRAV